MKKISNEEMKICFGIELANGKYKIYDKGDSYAVYSVKDDTEGCILVGTGTAPDRLYNSRAAFEKLFNKMEQADESGEEIWITIQ